MPGEGCLFTHRAALQSQQLPASCAFVQREQVASRRGAHFWAPPAGALPRSWSGGGVTGRQPGPFHGDSGGTHWGCRDEAPDPSSRPAA